MGKIIMDRKSKYNLENGLLNERSKKLYKEIHELCSYSPSNYIFTLELNNIEDSDLSVCIVLKYDKDTKTAIVVNCKNETEY